MMDDFDALDAGTAYALAGHLLDSQRPTDVDVTPHEVHVHVDMDQPTQPKPVLINANEGKPSPHWERFIGQERMKHQLRVHIASAKARDRGLEHVLLASGSPGTGKTEMARLIGKEMGGEFIMLVPPFREETLFEAVQSLPDKGVLFVDEVHRLMQSGRRAAENLLHILEERRLYLDSGMVQLNDITVIGATTDADLLPEAVISRFPIKPTFERYTLPDMMAIAAMFAVKLDVQLDEDDLVDLLTAAAEASQGVPRIARELVVAIRDLALATGQAPTVNDLLEFKQIQPNGMTRQHTRYLMLLVERFGVNLAKGGYEYTAGEDTMMTLLRETKQGLHRLERFLMECGLLDRGPRGRKLTERGIDYAMQLVEDRDYATWLTEEGKS